MFFNIRTKCFLEAARCLNFTKAAGRLYISQPALSKNIASLEQECGMKLFSREVGHSGVKLTPAGLVFLAELTKVEHTISGIAEKAKSADEGKEGNLIIGMLFGQIISNEARQVLDYITEYYPKIHVEKRSNGYKGLREWLDEGVTDTIVTLKEEAEFMDNVDYEEVARVPLGFVIPVGNPLASKKNLSMADIKGEKMLILKPDETFSVYDALREKCYLNGFKPVELEERDINSLHLSVELGNGITVSRADMMITKSPNVKFFPCEELGDAIVVAAWKKDNYNPIIPFYHRLYEEKYHKSSNE